MPSDRPQSMSPIITPRTSLRRRVQITDSGGLEALCLRQTLCGRRASKLVLQPRRPSRKFSPLMGVSMNFPARRFRINPRIPGKLTNLLLRPRAPESAMTVNRIDDAFFVLCFWLHRPELSSALFFGDPRPDFDHAWCSRSPLVGSRRPGTAAAARSRQPSRRRAPCPSAVRN